ncbi:MAG TPA: RNA methyltransferase [Mycobacteriales bacterium]|nr:RNA methyltransferase [Mycobacteriales bacterium]
MTEVFTERTPRVVAARKLTRRAGREAAGEFLAEGPQAVREALAHGARELFVTAVAADRHPELVDAARAGRVPVSAVTDKAAAALSETATPQGIVALCPFLDVPLEAALPGTRLVVLLADIRDPGNAGTVLRSADAAGADAVVLAGASVDPYNGKTVRASAGSLFHLPVVRAAPLDAAVDAARAAGLTVLAADGAGERDLDDLPELAGPTAWLFGNEAWGLPAELGARADSRVRIPISPRAESLNLAAAAAVCLFASARAQGVRSGAGPGSRAIP